MKGHAVRDELEQAKEVLIDAVVELARRRFRELDPDRSEQLLREYYRRASPLDLQGKDPADLYAAALRHWQLARLRRPGEILVRVYEPSPQEDGWRSRHTVVDVVTDDMPFIVDSLVAELEKRGITLHVLVHPVARAERDQSGELLDLHRPRDPGEPLHRDGWESFVHMEIDRLPGEAQREELRGALDRVLQDVRRAVGDFDAMRERALRLAAEMDRPAPPGTDPGEWTEAAALLRWMADENFVFLAARDYELDPAAVGDRVVSVEGTGLGLQRDARRSEHHLGDLPPAVAAMARSPRVLNLTKANAVSTVYKAKPFDYVGVKSFAADGTVTGEHRFLGFWSTRSYTLPFGEVPVIRRKVAWVRERAGFLPGSHDASQLHQALAILPRDELFQYGPEDLYDIALGIIDLRDRGHVSLFVRREDYGRWLSCLVLAPKDRYDTNVRLRIQEVLKEAYRGTRCSFSIVIDDEPIARLHLVVHTDAGLDEELPDTAAVRDRLALTMRTWEDDLRDALVEEHGEAVAVERFGRYAAGLPVAYREATLAETAVADIEQLEQLGDDDIAVRLLQPLEAPPDVMRLRVYRSGGPMDLSAMLPLLHDLGARVLDERPYEIRPEGRTTRWILDVGLRMPDEARSAERRAPFEEAFVAAWRGEVESDGFAGLVTAAGLDWRDVVVLRAYGRYLRQIGTRFTPSYIEEALLRNPEAAAALARLFRARFDPAPGGPDADAVRAELEELIDAVVRLDDDRILRSFRALIEATVRTNHFQADGEGRRRPALALKLVPSLVPDVPKPVPAHEIFVYSPRTEGVHLRAGRVARGGLRWSDRREDYRTEVLGLLKAQAVKNAVIVPAGAKGGFVAKRLPAGADRATTQAEVAACYDLFVSSLLDVTDDLVDGKVVPPAGVVRHDGDDPYLVVAADRGTATFSDRANRLALDRGFWLGDAFASGGSVGYDHKELGITARGAWVSVRRHFRELGMDADTDPITVVGIGDMSGDVFGNGMLRSSSLRLVAAFDHRHVFIDPDPDPARSYEERRRLAELPGSSWADYDPAVLSEGGVIIDRSEKEVHLPAPARELLGLTQEELTPNDVVSAVLRADVDLLWNGGIGTFVKASTERHEDVGDRANDAVRVDASELRCRVVAEGGNLGLTQLARIEFARNGGLVNTDAIDNSAGVDCSDHEVNLKILLEGAVRDGTLTRRHRDELLMSLAGEVCEQVLADNAAQTQALSIARSEAPLMVDVHARHIRWLEAVAGLDRGLEHLPTDEELAERAAAGEGLTRPELAVLLAYTKIATRDALLDSDLPDDPVYDEELLGYFPAAVRERFGDRIPSHPLRRELVATIVTNELVNRAGISMGQRLAEQTAAPLSEVARAHTAAWRIYGLEELWTRIEDLDGVVEEDLRIQMLREVRRLVERASRWLLRNRPSPMDVAAAVAAHRDPVVHVQSALADLLLGSDLNAWRQRAEGLARSGVPVDVAETVAGLPYVVGALDLATVAASTGAPIELVARTRFLLDDRLDLGWLRDQIVALPRQEHWQAMARSALIDDYYREHAQLTARVVAGARQGDDAERLVDSWVQARSADVARIRRVLADLQAAAGQEMARVSVGLRELRQLASTPAGGGVRG